MKKLILGVVDKFNGKHKEYTFTLEDHHDENYVNIVRRNFQDSNQFVATWKIVNEQPRV